jgi:hypothetical protein
MTTQSFDRAERRGGGFLPWLLIGIGGIWLLTQFNVLSGANLAVLARYWPLLLVAVGLNLLLGRRNPAVGRMVMITTLAVLVLLMVIGPALGLVRTPQVLQETFQTPFDNARNAEVSLNIGVAETTIAPLENSDELFIADVSYLGEMRFVVTGDETRRVTLSNEGDINTGFNWNFSFDTRPDLRWDVLVNPAASLDLTVNGGVGALSADLNGFDLTNLRLNVGVGGNDLVLPATGETYPVFISGGVGSTDITVADGAAIRFDINAGVGSITLDLPEDAAVRIQANGGLGEVDVPSDYTHISGEGSDGVWENAKYDEAGADERITILYNGGVGGLTIR